ncbi:MAG: 3-hydroxybutyryl-CoA dehydrogenase [Deltaproteobacteria bacterium]|jgi:3-hydroxybutyryl-CoA dehydrogenase|nr:3-hydroxybutyryl-CoA dehydrogenase [Deltaproteobacteria bacterium]
MKSILVIGAGTMGSGIAQVVAQGGFKVFLRDVKQEFVSRGVAGIDKNLARMVEKNKLQAAEKEAITGRITGIVDLSAAKDVDFVIEAAFEDMAVKKSIYQELDSTLKADAVLATNTSSLSITEVAAITKRPDKIIGMHFFNPAPVMALVEVIRGVATSEETYTATMALARALGKTPVTVTEAPGFVVNRILVPLVNEGAVVLSEGTATAEDIDIAMKLGANHPMGPLALGDLIGLDVCKAIMDVLYKETGDPKYRVAPIINKMVRAGKLGRKTKEGFFKY